MLTLYSLSASMILRFVSTVSKSMLHMEDATRRIVVFTASFLGYWYTRATSAEVYTVGMLVPVEDEASTSHLNEWYIWPEHVGRGALSERLLIVTRLEDNFNHKFWFWFCYLFCSIVDDRAGGGTARRPAQHRPGRWRLCADAPRVTVLAFFATSVAFCPLLCREGN